MMQLTQEFWQVSVPLMSTGLLATLATVTTFVVSMSAQSKRIDDLGKRLDDLRSEFRSEMSSLRIDLNKRLDKIDQRLDRMKTAQASYETRVVRWRNARGGDVAHARSVLDKVITR